jgi:hypothetical protein
MCKFCHRGNPSLAPRLGALGAINRDPGKQTVNAAGCCGRRPAPFAPAPPLPHVAGMPTRGRETRTDGNRKSVTRSPVARLIAIMVAASTLAGCAGPMTSPTYQNPNSRGFAQDAMARGPMLVKLQGRAYDSPEPQLADAVLMAMRSAMPWTATPQLTTAPEQAPTSLLVVMTFNGGVVDANVQCSGGSAGGGPQVNGAVQVTASFCGSGDLISNTSGRIDRSSGPADPAFAGLIRQITYDLFPSPGLLPLPGTGIRIGGGGSGVGIGIGF